MTELVETWTADGLRLHGALDLPDTPSNSKVDAVILFSGVGSNFYSSGLMNKIADGCVNSGIAALRVNTRGHDTVNTLKTRQGGTLQGAAYEVVDDCRHDVSAWVDFLTQQGQQRVGLIGHSLGALKVLYSQARSAHDAVAASIAVSPPRLNHELFNTGAKAADFKRSFRDASELVAAGQGQMLFQALFPFPMIRSATHFVDKYGPESRYDILKFSHEVKSPTLITFGEKELQTGGVAFAELDRKLAELDWSTTPAIKTIPIADHFYSGLGDEITNVICEFLRR